MKKGILLAALVAVLLSSFSIAASVVPNIAKYSSKAEDTVILEIKDSVFSTMSKSILSQESDEDTNLLEEKPKYYISIQNGLFKTMLGEEPVYIAEMLFSNDDEPVPVVKAEEETSDVLLGFSLEKGGELLLSAEELTYGNIADLVSQEKLTVNVEDKAIHLYANWFNDKNCEEPTATPEPQESPKPDVQELIYTVFLENGEFEIPCEETDEFSDTVQISSISGFTTKIKDVDGMKPAGFSAVEGSEILIFPVEELTDERIKQLLDDGTLSINEEDGYIHLWIVWEAENPHEDAAELPTTENKQITPKTETGKNE